MGQGILTDGAARVAGSDSLPGLVSRCAERRGARGRRGYFIAFGEPSHVDVNSDNGYSASTMTFKLRGRQIAQSGATYTSRCASCRRLADSAWAWAKGAPARH